MFGLLVEIGSFYVKFLAISACVRLGCHTNTTYANGVISSSVNDTPVEVVASDIRDVYAFPENALPVDDIMFDHDEFWRVVRVNELKVIRIFLDTKWS